MKCEKCGCNNEYNHVSCLTQEYIKSNNNTDKEVPEILTTLYRDHKRVYCCENCMEPIDYQDMPLRMFFNWLENSSNAGDSHEDSGKALIRYFKLDKLLGLQLKDGDES